MNTQFTSFSHFSQKHTAFVRRHSCKVYNSLIYMTCSDPHITLFYLVGYLKHWEWLTSSLSCAMGSTALSTGLPSKYNSWSTCPPAAAAAYIQSSRSPFFLYNEHYTKTSQLRWCPNSTTGDKIGETSYSHRVTSENKRIRTPSLTHPFKVGVIVVFYR